MLVILLSLLGILLQNASANTSSCSVDDFRNCRTDALKLMSGSPGSDAAQQESRCRNLRAKFDCMLWQTSMCYEKDDQDSNSDIIVKTWRYLQGFCEKYGNWWANSCFQRVDIKRCDSLLPSKRNSLDGQSCSMFVNFRDCVSSIAASSCSSSDMKLLGTYFMEKGEQMAWRCPKDNDFKSVSAASAQQVYRRHPDIMYGDSSDPYNPCIVKIRDELPKCTQKFTDIKMEIKGKSEDAEATKRQLCCGFVEMQECLNDLEKKCTGGTKSVLDTALSPFKAELGDTCDDYDAQKCSGANSINAAAAAYLSLYLVYLLFVKKFL